MGNLPVLPACSAHLLGSVTGSHLLRATLSLLENVTQWKFPLPVTCYVCSIIPDLKQKMSELQNVCLYKEPFS